MDMVVAAPQTERLESKENPDVFWAYLAGFVDGEGSISICQNGPRLTIANTYLPVLEEIQICTGLGTIKEVNRTSAIRTKPCYNYNGGANVLRAVLPYLIPFLREKKELALAMMEYLATLSKSATIRNDPDNTSARESAKSRFFAEVEKRRGSDKGR